MENIELNERRRTGRIPLSAPQPLNTEGEERLYLVGISPSGAEIISPEKPVYDGVVDFTIPLPTKIHTLSLSARIVWQKMKNRWHAGVAFLPMTDADRQIVRAYRDYLRQDNELQSIRKTLTANLKQLATNFDRLQSLLAGFIRARQVVDEPRPRYLH